MADRGKLRVAIVGAGISGLVAAYRLSIDSAKKNVDCEIKIFESSDRVGGVIKSEKSSTRVIEHGPDAWLASKPGIMELVEELGLSDQVISTNESNRRSLIAKDGRLHPLPDGFVMLAPSRLIPLANSTLFSLSGKIRMVLDLVTPAKHDRMDETVESFVMRRFGREALDTIVQPMVGGIYVGDVVKLSAQSTLTQFVEMERRYGSVIRGLMARKNNAEVRTASGARYSMFVTLRGGLQTLVNRLVEKIGPDRIETHCPVHGFERTSDGNWRLLTANGDEVFDSVIFATPAKLTASIVRSFDSQTAIKLSGVETASAAVVNLTFKRSAVPRPVDGFGFVVPKTEKRSVLAASFISNKFDNRGDADELAVRAFVGGMLQPELLNKSDDELISIVCDDLEYYLGVKSQPLTQDVTRFPASMPQYNIGHSARVQEIMSTVTRKMPGVFLAGNSYYGVGIPDCVVTAGRAACAAIEYARSLSSVESVAT